MKLFIFDMGKVVVTNLHINQGMADELGVDLKTFREDYWIYDRALMEGWMSPEAYYRHLEIKFGKPVRRDLARRHFNPVPNGPLLSAVSRLRARGYRCVIGSNTFAPHWEKMQEEFSGTLGCFDRCYPSYLMHRAKPDASFFRYIQQEEGLPFSEMAFIDDRWDNIVTAEKLGITTLFYSGDGLEERTKEFFRPYLSRDLT